MAGGSNSQFTSQMLPVLHNYFAMIKEKLEMIVWSNQAYKLRKAIILSHHELHVRTDEKQTNKLIGYKKANDFCPNLN